MKNVYEAKKIPWFWLSAFLSIFTKRFSVLAPACSHCDDYHRFCPALHDPGFAAKYQEILSAGNLKPDFNIRVVPEPVNCENEFYKISCPKSCNMCEFILLNYFRLQIIFIETKEPCNTSIFYIVNGEIKKFFN